MRGPGNLLTAAVVVVLVSSLVVGKAGEETLNQNKVSCVIEVKRGEGRVRVSHGNHKLLIN